MPSEREQAKPILKEPWKPTITDKPVPVPTIVIDTSEPQSRKSIKDVVLDAIRHFITGFTLAGGPALGATVVAGASLAGPVGWTVLGLAVVSGIVEAARKTTKTVAEDTGKKDWLYYALNLLEIVLVYLKSRYEKKSIKK